MVVKQGLCIKHWREEHNRSNNSNNGTTGGSMGDEEEERRREMEVVGNLWMGYRVNGGE